MAINPEIKKNWQDLQSKFDFIMAVSECFAVYDNIVTDAAFDRKCAVIKSRINILNDYRAVSGIHRPL